MTPAENLIRVVGPPGTGKTTFLRRQVETWIDRDGIAPEAIVLCSFTRTAAEVLRGRMPVPDHNCATLHSLAYRALGGGIDIAEVGDLAKQWNEQAIPESWKIGSATADLEEGLLENSDRGAMLAAYSLWRSTLCQNTALAEQTKYFAPKWEDFKAQTNSKDFTDLIDFALVECSTCPGDPACFVVDEAQDLQPLQWLLVHQWGAAAEHFLVAGDPAQVLYEWIGARPDELLLELPPERTRLLGQSHRLPRAVHAAAEEWLKGHSGPLSHDREYRPLEREGSIEHREYTWREPLSLLDDIAGAEGPVMVLATCSYLLGPALALLRDAGVPFHNPYRRREGKWNPLHPPGAGKISTVVRVRQFLADSWTGPGVCDWLEMLPAAWYLRTKKATLAELSERRTVSREQAAALMVEQARAAVLGRDLRWLEQAVAKQYRHPAEFASRILQRDPALLDQEPRVIVGTIHSVKGGEADTVILFPDLPRVAMESAGYTEGRDGLIRRGYVGMTRAQDRLIHYTAEREDLSIWNV